MVKLSDLLVINHCRDWAPAGVTSFGRQIDFHDMYYMLDCNGDKRRRNVVLQLLDVQMYVKYAFQSEQEPCWKF